jgi:hypothetical protein
MCISYTNIEKPVYTHVIIMLGDSKPLELEIQSITKYGNEIKVVSVGGVEYTLTMDNCVLINRK